MRRLSFRCAPRSPWKVFIKVELPTELFQIIRTLASTTNYGLFTGETKRNTRRLSWRLLLLPGPVKSLFNKIMGTSYSDDEFLKKKFKNKKRIEAIVNEEKQFGMTYDFD